MAHGRAVAIVLSEEERGELARRVRHRKSSRGAARRARIALLTEQQIGRGAHRSTAELEAAVERYIASHNRDPRPFR